MAQISDMHLKDAIHLAELYEKRSSLVKANACNHGHRGNVLSNAINIIDTQITIFFSRYDKE